MISGSSHPTTPPDAVAPAAPLEERERRGLRLRRFRTVGPEDSAFGELVAYPADTSVAVVGLAEAGLATALTLTEQGFTVSGVDFSRDRLEQIASGRAAHTVETKRRLNEALLHPNFTLWAELRVIANVDVVMICVPTAVDDHMLPDLAPLANACADVVRLAREGQLIILTSGSYAGTTTDLLVGPLESLGFTVGRDINVAFSPDRLGADEVAGVGIPRIVGGATAACRGRAQRVLQRVSAVHTVSSLEAAEMTRLFENTFRAVNIALVNEFSSACHELGMEPMEIIDAAATNPGGFTRFTPGPGVGGHTVPVDPHHLTWQMRRYRTRMPVVDAAMNAIAERPRAVVDRIQRLLSERGVPAARARVLVVGVAYKPNGGDALESTAVEIVDRLLALGVQVDAVDERVRRLPLADGRVLAVARLGDVAVADYHLVLVHTLHDDDDLAALADAALVLDATYQLDPASARVTL